MKSKGFGAKVYLNNQLRHLKSRVVPLAGVNHCLKSQKGWPTKRVITEFLRESDQVAKQHLASKSREY